MKLPTLCGTLYLIYKNQHFVPILNQLSPVLILTPCCINIYLINVVILPPYFLFPFVLTSFLCRPMSVCLVHPTSSSLI